MLLLLLLGTVYLEHVEHAALWTFHYFSIIACGHVTESSGIHLITFLAHLLQDKDFSLQLDACFKLESGKVCVVEPLDHLLSCVSWLLLLQSHGKSEHQSEDSWPCFGFSLSQENEVMLQFVCKILIYPYEYHNHFFLENTVGWKGNIHRVILKCIV